MSISRDLLGHYQADVDGNLIIDRFLEVNTKALAQAMYGVTARDIVVLYIDFKGPGNFLDTVTAGSRSITTKELEVIPTTSEFPMVIAYNRSVIKAMVKHHRGNDCPRPEVLVRIIVYLWVQIAKAFRLFAVLCKSVKQEELIPPRALIQLKFDAILAEDIVIYREKRLSDIEMKLRVDTSFISAYVGMQILKKSDRREELKLDELAELIRDTTRFNWQELVHTDADVKKKKYS